MWDTFEMAGTIAIAQQIRQWNEENAQGGDMAAYDRAKVWADYQELYGPLPALLKARAEHPELGDAIERDSNGNPIEHDYGKYRVSFYAGGVAWAEIDNWSNRGAATSEDALPLA